MNLGKYSLDELKKMLGSGDYKGDEYKEILQEVRNQKKIHCSICDAIDAKWYQPITTPSGGTDYYCPKCDEKRRRE